MPIYEYAAKDSSRGCEHCRNGFETMQKMSDASLTQCPCCGASVTRVFSSFAAGEGKTNIDRKAKEKGFHKLKRVDKGKYEKLY